MKRVELHIVPYASKNDIKVHLVVDGNIIDSKDNRLTNLVVYQPMRKWLNPYKKKLFVWEGLLAEIIEEFNDKSINFIFFGNKADFTLFKKCIALQQSKLNRNGIPVELDIKFNDKSISEKALKEIIEIMNDLYVEADNWGEDEIIKEINLLKNLICSCSVNMNLDYITSSNEFKNAIKNNDITLNDDSQLTIIPVDDYTSVSDISNFLTSLNDADKEYVIINFSTSDSKELLDVVLLLNDERNTNVKYIESENGTYISEIKKIYYLFLFPTIIQKLTDILHMFPDSDTNSFLIDVSNKLYDLFQINL